MLQDQLQQDSVYRPKDQIVEQRLLRENDQVHKSADVSMTVHNAFSSFNSLSNNGNARVCRNNGSAFSHPTTRLETYKRKSVKQLFRARCKDLGITTVNAKLKENFVATADRIFCGKLLSFKDLGLGSESLLVVAKIVNTYVYESDEFRHRQVSKLLPSHLNLANASSLKIQKTSKDEAEFCASNELSVKYLIKSITSHKRLVYVNLQNNGLGDRALGYLFKHLQSNMSIVHLDVGNSSMQGRNKIRRKAAESLRNLLRLNSVLQILNLEN